MFAAVIFRSLVCLCSYFNTASIFNACFSSRFIKIIPRKLIKDTDAQRYFVPLGKFRRYIRRQRSRNISSRERSFHDSCFLLTRPATLSERRIWLKYSYLEVQLVSPVLTLQISLGFQGDALSISIHVRDAIPSRLSFAQ